MMTARLPENESRRPWGNRPMNQKDRSIKYAAAK
jgi:hypothetical protein